MKKLFVLLLAVMVMSSLALVAVACGDEADAELDEAMEELDEAMEELDALDEELDEAMDEAVDTDSDVSTPADIQALGDQLIADYKAAGSPEDKSTFVVEDVTFVGPVMDVKDKGTFWIVVIGDDTASANVLITYDTLATAGMTSDVLQAWIGSDIQVSGDIVVNDWGSLAEIQIADPLTQINVPE